ncbi:MAG: HAD hydrolase-like protein [Bacteroidota bacterium]|jgi:phosphoglycolate phosphatase-like HAD superfamily hydrolase|nr:HAD hydrolase-like protein [Bacteroidota bacterium]
MITKQYLRLVLFDIDGTLISTNGVAKQCFVDAMEEVLGVATAGRGYDFGGKTDPQIFAEIVRASGLPESTITTHADAVFASFFQRLEHALDADNVTVMPGVRTLLEALKREEAATLALLTGNMLQGARIKLTPPDLLGYFSFGAFGNDAYHRHDLPEIAVARAYDRTGATFRAKDIVIIGDTVHDIDCGRHLNVRSIGVATGGHAHEVLAQAKPDVLFDDLTDTDRILDAIFD